MDFYFSGDLDNLKEYIDIENIGLVSEGGYDKTEFKFFNGKTPDTDDLIISVDGYFDLEYDILGSRFLFVVAPDEKELKKAVDVNPSLVEANNLLTAYYLSVHDKSRAKKTIYKTLKVDKRNPKALEYLAELTSSEIFFVARAPTTNEPSSESASVLV